MTQILKQSTAVDVLIGPFLDLTDGATAETGESPSVKLAKNGQALAAKSDATTPVHDADGYYNCELDATDTNTVGTLVLTVAKSANALPVRHEFQVVEENVYDAWYAASAAAGTDLASILTDTSTTLQAELDGIQADTEDIQSRLPAALVGGRIDATVDGTGMESGAVDAILDEVVEGSYTMRQFLRLFASALGAKVSGAATTTIVFRDTGDTKDRITATVDEDGNRTAITLDLS